MQNIQVSTFDSTDERKYYRFQILPIHIMLSKMLTIVMCLIKNTLCVLSTHYT